jgi:recombination protein RecR
MADAMRRLINLLRQLPGVGEKTASRLVFYILSAPPDFGQALSGAIRDVVEQVGPCELCGNLSEQSPCTICSDPRRDGSVICVVEKVPDLLAIENTHEFRGLYHVLQGLLSPLDGTGPDQIRAEELISRIQEGDVREVILAVSPNVEGEATALYLKKRMESMGVKVSRIASGIPVGGELEYVDKGTIGRALSGRREMS